MKTSNAEDLKSWKLPEIHIMSSVIFTESGSCNTIPETTMGLIY